MRIALGSDHRGGKIAKAILSDVLFPEHYKTLEPSKQGVSDPMVGACLITGTMMPDKQFHGSAMSPIEISGIDAGIPLEGNETAFLHVDYPDVAAAVAGLIYKQKADLGILCCGTGIGMCIVANKYPGIRAATCYNELSAELSRCHNNANILCLPGEFLGVQSAINMVQKWLSTSYEGGRHQIRLDKIKAIEQRTGL